MKKALLIILTIILTLGAMVGLSVTAFAQDTMERDIIPLPEIPAINRPYKTTEELGIDFKAFDEYFPQNIEIRQEDGKIYVEDIGAGCAKFYTSQTKDLELVDGYWTGDIEGDLQFVYFYSYENYREDKYWHVVYHSDGERDPYIILQDDSVYIGFSNEYATVSYDSGDYFYVDQYTNGVLDTHSVGNRKDTEIVEVYYDVNGEVSYCQLYTNTYYYYYPNQGWSSSWISFVECDAPVGYEDIDETYFTVNKPSLICNSAEGDDIVHDMLDASCMEPAKCKNCTYTEGYALTHSWAESTELPGKRVCTACGAINFPDIEFVTRYYETVEESGFDVEEILNLFPRELETKYENGKYMIKDIGSEYAEYYDCVDFTRTQMTLENGYWTIEISEDRYNTALEDNESLWVKFHAEGYFWQVEYQNGRIEHNIQLATPGNVEIVLIYLDMDLIEFSYPIGDKFYTNTYKNGVISEQRIIVYLENNELLYIDYSGDGTLKQVTFYSSSTGKFSYYIVGYGWSSVSYFDPKYACSAPPSYEDADEEFFKALAPTSINCMHEEYKGADCLNPELCAVCGLAKEGSMPLGHDIVIDEATDPTCTETGLTEGSHCSSCDEETIEQETVPALGHDYDDGAVTTAPTCTEKGVKTFNCQNDENHTYTEEVEALGHKYDNACDADCNTCGEERTPAEHYSENRDGKCDECGEKFELSGGAIAGIVIGSALVLGGGGFALFWFVIRKKIKK